MLKGDVIDRFEFGPHAVLESTSLSLILVDNEDVASETGSMSETPSPATGETRDIFVSKRGLFSFRGVGIFGTAQGSCNWLMRQQPSAEAVTPRWHEWHGAWHSGREQNDSKCR